MPSEFSAVFDRFYDKLGNVKEDIASRLAATNLLFEQLDTSNWSPNDVRAYQSLVDERVQLEIDHHRLATSDIAFRSGKRYAMTADLREIELNFKYDAIYATYRYYGDNACLLERVKSCSHDLCRRALSEGLPYLEYDTIIHYDMRIITAKTTRMKDALRKQRDVQLSKDAKAIAAWKEKCINKMGSFGQEAQEAIVKTATEITGWKFSSATIQIEPDTPAEQVGRALCRMRASTLSAEEALFGGICLDRLCSSKKSQCHWKVPSPYMEYFSSIQTDHLEAAIAAIQRVLDMNAIAYYECYSCLKSFLKDYREVVQWTELPHRKPGLGATVGTVLDDAKVALTLDEMRGSPYPPPKETTPRDPPKSLLCKALKECTDIENHAQLEMWRVQTQHAERGSDPQAGLAEIKRKGIDASPMPSVSKIALSRLELMNKEYCIVNTLLHRAKSGISSQNLVDAVSDHLRKVIGDDWTKFIPTCRSLRSALHSRPIDEQNTTDELAHEQLEKAFAKIQDMGNNFSAGTDKQVGQVVEEKRKLVEDLTKPLLADILENTTEYYLLPGMSRGAETELILTEYVKSIVIQQKDFEPTRSNWRKLITEKISRGMGEAFRVYQRFCKHDMCGADNIVLKTLTDESDEMADLLGKDPRCFQTFFHRLYEKDCCLASVFLRLLATLPRISLLNPASAASILDILNIVSKTSLSSGVFRQMQSRLAEFCGILVQVYGYITIESVQLFGRADVEQITLSLIFILAFGVLTARSTDQAKFNLNFVLSFTDMLFGQFGSVNPTACFKQIKILFEKLADTPGFRCCDPVLCMKYQCHPFGSTNTTVPESSPQPEQRRDALLGKLDITIYSDKSSAKQQSKQLLDRPKAVLSGLIDKELKQCTPLERGKVLKYCAHQIKMFDTTAKQPNRPKDFGRMDAEFIDLLWRAFMRTEQVICVTEPSSLNIGMHNRCNIWELVESKEKTCGFMEGHRRGYRSDNDLKLLAYSCAQYAILNGKREAMPAFHRKRDKLRELAGELPEKLELFLIDEGDSLEEAEMDDVAALRQTYLRLEYMYQSDPSFFRLDTRYFAEMLDLDVNQFMVFTNTLRNEIALIEGEKPVEILDNAVDTLVDQTKAAKYISSDDTNLKIVQAAACRAWQRSPHEEYIFSEDEGDDEESFGYDFMARCCGTQKSADTTKPVEDADKALSNGKVDENVLPRPSKRRKAELRTATEPVESQSAVHENGVQNTTDPSTVLQTANPPAHAKASEVNSLHCSEADELALPVFGNRNRSSTKAADRASRESTTLKIPELEKQAETSRLESSSSLSEPVDNDLPSAADTKPQSSPFYNKLLALKGSLATIKSVMDFSDHEVLDLVPFCQLQQKTRLAELQCEYMLKTLRSRERSEAGDEQDGEDDDDDDDEDARKLLEQIDIASQRVKGSMAKSNQIRGDEYKGSIE